MADIATIGFRAETADLADAKVKLDALTPAAARAEKASDKLAQSATATGGAMQRAAAGMTAAGNAMDSAAAGAGTAGKSVDAAGAAAGKSAGMWARLTDAIRSYLGMAARVPAASGKATKAVNDNVGMIKANTGNIAAQFQDIGVTAFMGMSPLLIALQQGTQLSAVFAQSGGNAFKTLGAAIGQVLSPTALFTIGIVAAAAALIQFVDWGKLAKSALNGLADILPTIAPYAVALAAGLALVYSPAIIAGLWSLITAFGSLAASILATVGLPALVVAGLIAVVAAAVIFRDQLTQYFGYDIVKSAKDGLNKIIGGFIGAFRGIVKIWGQLPAVIGDVAIGAANNVIAAINGMLTSATQRLNSFIDAFPAWMYQDGKKPFKAAPNIAMMSNPYDGAAAKGLGDYAGSIAAAQGQDWIGMGVDAVKGGADWAAKKLRTLAAGLGKKPGDKKKKGAEDSPDKPTNDTAKAALGLIKAYGHDIASAMDDMIKAAKKRADAFAEIIDGANETISKLEFENTLFGKTAEQVDRARFMYDALAEAKRKHIVLTDAELLQIGTAADKYASLNKQIDQTREAMDFAKGATRGFLGDLMNGLQQGQSFFENFGNAVMNVLNKLLDKMLDFATEAAFNGGQSGGGGFLNSLLKVVGLAGGSSSIATGASTSLGSIGAGMVPHAKGGVIGSPMMFDMAGGKTGIAGEAGEEGVLPLTRGPDGSLGVQMYGGKGASGAPTNNVEVHNHYHLSGAISSDDVRKMVRSGAEAAASQTQDAVRRSLAGWLDEYQQNGAIV